MALTEEQIDNLKKGDPIVIHGKFLSVDNEGDIWAAVDGSELWFSPSCVSLPSKPGTSVPTPKSAPARLFKKGDKVRVVEKDGRTVHDPLNGGLWKVGRNERSGGACETSVLVHLFYEDEKIAWQISVPFCFLELVVPVEELEPYKVWDTTFSFNVGVEDSKAVFYYGADMSTCPYTKEQAKAAAYAERDRLNAEHRKEHGND